MNLLEELKAITKEENIFVDEPMKNHTTFRTGGKADFLVTPETKKEIIDLLSLDSPITVIGNGSNLLVKDGGIRGLTIQLTKYNEYDVKDDVIEAASGCYLAKLSQVALQNGLSGLEFACGIPGTLGGAVMMNAGAYGFEISSVVLESDFLTYDGVIEKYTDHQFGYRKSVFQNRNGIILYCFKKC